jgi:hypothetical protein
VLFHDLLRSGELFLGRGPCRQRIAFAVREKHGLFLDFIERDRLRLERDAGFISSDMPRLGFEDDGATILSRGLPRSQLDLVLAFCSVAVDSYDSFTSTHESPSFGRLAGAGELPKAGLLGSLADKADKKDWPI